MKGEDKRTEILAAAEEIISKRGLAKTTISEIASRAGVADSFIYQFFKGKQDLAFKIPLERGNEFNSSLHEHLQGIGDSESRLSKAIWFYLRYMDGHPGYGRILFFECLSSTAFYLSPGYEVVRKFAEIVLEILSDGVKEGHFNPSTDTHLVRDVILGTLGCEVILSVAEGEARKGVTDHESIMTLVRSMILPGEQVESSKADTILDAAMRVFSEKGFSNAKVSEIAKLAQVAEGTVYEYFGTKERLLLAISEKYFETYLSDISEVLETRAPIKKLRRFMRYFFWLFSREREFLKVFLLQLQLSERWYRTKEFGTFLNYFRAIESIIEEGKADGSFRQDVNPRVFRNMFVGTFNNLALRWFVLEGDRNVDKMRKIDQLTDLLSSAVSVPSMK